MDCNNMNCNESIRVFMKGAGSFSIPDVQTEFNMSYGDTRELFRSLEKEKSIELTDGIAYLWIAKEEIAEPSASLTETEDKAVAENDPNDDPFDVLSVIRKRRRDDWPREVIEGFMRRKGYTEDKKHVRLDMSVSYPDGTPFEIEYIYDDEHSLTDNGGLKRYLEGITGNMLPEIQYDWIRNTLDKLDDSTALMHREGKLWRDAGRCFDEEDVRSLVFYFVDEIDNFICTMREKFQDRELSESDKYALSVTMEGVARDSCGECFYDEMPAYGYPLYNVMKRVATCHEDMTRGHAIELAGRMIELARERGSGNLETFELLFEELSRLSDLEFKILKHDIFSVL